MNTVRYGYITLWNCVVAAGIHACTCSHASQVLASCVHDVTQDLAQIGAYLICFGASVVALSSGVSIHSEAELVPTWISRWDAHHMPYHQGEHGVCTQQRST